MCTRRSQKAAKDSQGILKSRQGVDFPSCRDKEGTVRTEFVNSVSSKASTDSAHSLIRKALATCLCSTSATIVLAWASYRGFCL